MRLNVAVLAAVAGSAAAQMPPGAILYHPTFTPPSLGSMPIPGAPQSTYVHAPLQLGGNTNQAPTKFGPGDLPMAAPGFGEPKPAPFVVKGAEDANNNGEGPDGPEDADADAQSQGGEGGEGGQGGEGGEGGQGSVSDGQEGDMGIPNDNLVGGGSGQTGGPSTYPGPDGQPRATGNPAFAANAALVHTQVPVLHHVVHPLHPLLATGMYTYNLHPGVMELGPDGKLHPHTHHFFVAPYTPLLHPHNPYEQHIAELQKELQKTWELARIQADKDVVQRAADAANEFYNHHLKMLDAAEQKAVQGHADDIPVEPDTPEQQARESAEQAEINKTERELEQKAEVLESKEKNLHAAEKKLEEEKSEVTKAEEKVTSEKQAVEEIEKVADQREESLKEQQKNLDTGKAEIEKEVEAAKAEIADKPTPEQAQEQEAIVAKENQIEGIPDAQKKVITQVDGSPQAQETAYEKEVREDRNEAVAEQSEEDKAAEAVQQALTKQQGQAAADASQSEQGVEAASIQQHLQEEKNANQAGDASVSEESEGDKDAEEEKEAEKEGEADVEEGKEGKKAAEKGWSD